jgi:ATP-binding cassette subfamily B protein
MPFIVGRTDDLVMEYIEARRSHFRVIFRQAAAHYLFRAMASAGVLAVGGWLVINRQLTLGQLVAANLIVVSVLAAIEKLLGLLESSYDLLTALDKVGHLTDLPVEDGDRRKPLLKREQGASIVCRNVRFSYLDDMPVLCNLDLTVKAGERISIVGKSGAGKSTLAAILCGLLEQTHGAVLLDKIDVRDIARENLRENVALVSSNSEVFEGTIEDNVLVGRDFSHEELTAALETAQLSGDLAAFSRGIKTKVISEGRNLSSGQIQRLLIARAIIGRPRLLILDEAFAGVDEQDKLQILDLLFAPEQDWTIIDISHDPEVVLRAATIHVLENGRIVETTSPEQISHSEQTAFSRCFPRWRQRLRLNPALP